MAWAARDDSDTGWFHVLNRGVDRCQIFRDGQDARAWLNLLGTHAIEHGVEIHAYCLLGNHYHLLLHAPEGGVSTMMQQIVSKYVRRFNVRHDRDGPLFRSRFRSIRITDKAYLAIVGRYIHRNSLDRFPSRSPRSYKWSSMKWYVTDATAPAWIHTRTLLSFHPSRRSYEEFVGGATANRPTEANWAIRLAVAMCDDEDLAALTHLDRTIASLLGVDSCQGRDTAARRKAARRAQQRLDRFPRIADVVNVARELIDANG